MSAFINGSRNRTAATGVPESLAKGAKHAKGDSQASNSKLVIDRKQSESGRFPERTTVDDLPTA